MQLTQDQIINIYAETNLKGDKRDATVNGKQIPFSGVANHILFENTPVNSTHEAINSLISIEDYVDSHPDVYFACKALNYGTLREKYDRNKPLAVYVDWSAKTENLVTKFNLTRLLNREAIMPMSV